MKRLIFWLGWCWIAVWAWALPPKNIIVMIPDGTGDASLTVAREVKGAPLAVDAWQCGSVQTRSASHVVTDSAAAGTALSCGERTTNGMVGVTTERVPLVTFGEWAKARGMAVGIVTTDWVTGATPSAFSAHVVARNDASTIVMQQITSGFDLFLAGGQSLLTPTLLALLKEEGYTLVRSADELQVAEGKTFGLFSPGLMTAMVERRGVPSTEPTLAEMTQRALDLLAEDPDGFFLMVEGAQVDKGNHEHDLAWATYELLAFDDAVATVQAWVKGREDTLVVITPDHETGGLTVHDEVSPDARAQALRNATSKQAAKAAQYSVSYSTTWHTGVDVFLASNDPLFRISRNCDLRSAITGEGAVQLAELHGRTELREEGTVLISEDGRVYRAQQDAIYVPSTGKWYQR